MWKSPSFRARDLPCSVLPQDLGPRMQRRIGGGWKCKMVEMLTNKVTLLESKNTIISTCLHCHINDGTVPYRINDQHLSINIPICTRHYHGVLDCHSHCSIRFRVENVGQEFSLVNICPQYRVRHHLSHILLIFGENDHNVMAKFLFFPKFWSWYFDNIQAFLLGLPATVKLW